MSARLGPGIKCETANGRNGEWAKGAQGWWGEAPEWPINSHEVWDGFLGYREQGRHAAEPRPQGVHPQKRSTNRKAGSAA